MTESTHEIDPNGKDAHAPGAKLDAGKLLGWLFISGFARALANVADVTTRGARKYTPGGWATVPNGSERYMEAFARHQFDLAKGSVFDDGPQGTGCRHKAQMIWNLAASLELDLRAEEEAAHQAEATVSMASKPQQSMRRPGASSNRAAKAHRPVGKVGT